MMSDPISEKLLRVVLRATPGTSWWRRCPNERQLAAYIDSELDTESLSRIAMHLAGCKHCSAVVAFGVRAQDTSQKIVVPPTLLAKARALGNTPRPSRSLGWRWAPVTAATCLTLAFLTYLRLPEPVLQVRKTSVPEAAVPEMNLPAPSVPSQAPVVTPPAEPRTVRNRAPGIQAFQIVSPQGGARVALSNIELRWTRVAGALLYEVQLLGAEGTLLWQNRVEGVEVRLPSQVPLVPEVSHFIMVRAYLADGRVVKSRASEFIPFAAK